MKHLLLIIAVVILSSCGGENSNIPEDITYSIIKEDRNDNLSKTNIEIRLNKKTTEEVLSEIAKELKSEREGLTNLWIFYYLPDMETGKGAWATSHYSPNLEVNILGATEEESEKLESKTVTGEINGEWQDTEPMMESKLYLVKEDGKLLMKTVYTDGSESVEELTEKNQNGLVWYNYENTHGEYYIIEKNGNLGFYDTDGKFKEAKK